LNMFYIISFLLVSIGIAVLPVVERAGFSLILALTLFSSGFILTELFKKSYFSKSLIKLLVSLLILTGVIGSFILGSSREWAAVWIIWYSILAFQVITIFNHKDLKSWSISYLLSFIQLSLGGVFRESLFFIIIFIIYLALMVFGLILIFLKTGAGERALRLAKPRLYLAKWGALTTVNVFFITGLVFLILPRTQSPFFQIKRDIHLVETLKEEHGYPLDIEEVSLSFPDKIELNTLSELKNQDMIVMLVERESPALLKVQTFNHYDGKSWTKRGSRPVAIKVEDGQVNLKPLYLNKELFSKITPDKFYHQKFYIKSYAEQFIAGSYPIINLIGLDAAEIEIDHFENIYLQKKLKPGDRYEVVSVDKSYPSNYLRTLPRTYPKEIMDLYLQLPPDLDQRLMNLASEILKYTPPNIYDELITVRKYLKDNCRYGRLTKESPTLSEFLFENKPGDCEYFATALALMLRYRNIPTRFVLGFSGGDFDPKRRTSIIYARDAHAWIEVFFPNVGWLSCDPTPRSLSQSQWEEDLKFLASKPAGLEDRALDLKDKVSDSDYLKQDKIRSEITGEGSLEEELLPEEYYFKDRLSQRSLPEDEIIFSEEFFEEQDSSVAMGIKEDESEEILKESHGEKRDILAKERGSLADSLERDGKPAHKESSLLDTEYDSEYQESDSAEDLEQDISLESVSAEREDAIQTDSLEREAEIEYGFREQLDSDLTERAEEDPLYSRGLEAEEQRLEEEIFPDQYPEQQDSISEELYLEEYPASGPGLYPEDSMAKDEDSAALEERMSDIDIIAEDVVFKEDIILEKMPEEDIVLEREAPEQPDILEDDYIPLEDSIAAAELDFIDDIESVEESEFGEYPDKEPDRELLVKDDALDLDADIEIEREEDFLYARESLDPALKAKEQKEEDDIERFFKEPKEEIPAYDSLEQRLREDLISDQSSDSFKAGQDHIEPEDIIIEDLESEKAVVEDMIPEDSAPLTDLEPFSAFKGVLKEWVLGFSYHTQALILDAAKKAFMTVRDFCYRTVNYIYSHIKHNRRNYSGAAVLIILGYTLWTLFRWLLKKRDKRKEFFKLFSKKKLTKEEKKVRGFYFQVLDILAGAGYKRLSHLTPREFAAKLIAKDFSISKDFYYLTDMFYRIIFGHIELSLDELNKADSITASIKEWVRDIKS
jgi:hypothetical protein